MKVGSKNKQDGCAFEQGARVNYKKTHAALIELNQKMVPTNTEVVSIMVSVPFSCIFAINCCNDPFGIFTNDASRDYQSKNTTTAMCSKANQIENTLLGDAGMLRYFYNQCKNDENPELTSTRARPKKQEIDNGNLSGSMLRVSISSFGFDLVRFCAHCPPC